MSGGLEEKILGEKPAGYCDSSDEEPNDEAQATAGPPAPPQEGNHQWRGFSQNTGPKGVLRDWQLFKEQQEQARIEREAGLLNLCKEKAMTTAPYETEIKDDDLLSEEVYQSFLKKRMNEMMEANCARYGKVVELKDGNDFLETLDNAPHSRFMVVHVYEPGDVLCQKMNECLDEVAAAQASNADIRFLKAIASKLETSSRFKSKGVPALLVYKAGDLVGNFVQIQEQIGTDFFPGDIENFLVDKGIIAEFGTGAALPNVTTAYKSK